MKDEYKVGVFLPFLEPSTNPNALSRSNQFAYDLYAGMRLACRWLEEHEKVKIRLFAYDTDQDTARFKASLADPGMPGMDLVIGPLYASTIPIMATYSKEFMIPSANPVSYNSGIIDDNPYAFMFFPSFETQGAAAAGFVHENFGKSNAFIIYGKSEEERRMAEAYRKKHEENGGTVRMYESIDFEKGSFAQLMQKFRPMQSDTLRTFGTNHVFACVNEQAAAVTVTSALQTMRVRVPVVATEAWLGFQQIGYDQMEASNVYLIYPKFANKGSGWRKIVSLYVKEANMLPLEYVFYGFETIHAFGKLLKEHGTGFWYKVREQEQPFPGVSMAGSDFRQGNDNQYVPIVRFEKGLLKLSNPPEWLLPLLTEAENSNKND